MSKLRNNNNSVFGQGNQKYHTESRATTHVDLYKVLGLENNCSIDDIEAAYSRGVKQYHPDKVRVRHMAMVSDMDKKKSITDAEREKLDIVLMRKMDESKETFNMVNTAYHKLSSDRAGYDAEHTRFVANAEDDYTSMRGSSKAFMDSQVGTAATDRDQATFKTQWDVMNRKHGYNPELSIVPLKEHETKDRLSTLLRQRGQMDVDTLPEKLFDQKINAEQFNAAFEKNYGRQGGDAKTEIRPFDGADINGAGGNEASGMFGELDKVDNLYSDEAGGSFAPISMAAPVSFTKKDLIGIEISHNTHGYNKKTDSDRSEMQRRMNEHNTFTQQLQTRTVSDFSQEYEHGFTAGLESLVNQQKPLERLEFAARPEQVAQYRNLLAANQRRTLTDNSQGRQSAAASSSSGNQYRPSQHSGMNMAPPVVVTPPALNITSMLDRPRPTRG